MAKSTEGTAKRLANLKPPFKPGECGNPAGRPKGTRNIKTILSELLEITEKVKNPVTGEVGEVSQIEMIAAKLVVMAKNGDLASIDRVLDRTEGKPATSINLGGQQDNPVETNITIKFVD